MSVHRCLRAVAFLGALIGTPVNAQTFTSADIFAVAGTSPQCLDWRIAGVCFWLVCSPFSCWIETSARISHNLPDLVVTAYNEPGKSPWIEGRSVYGSAASGRAGEIMSALGGSVLGGGSHTSDGTSNRGNLRFKEVDVIGSPTGLITDVIADTTGYLCPTESQPMLPYFLSGFDAFAWRTGVPDNLRPEAYVPGLREIGHWPTNTWGKVFPRSGFLVQTDDAKVGGVTSQRAIDVVLQVGQPHVYVPFGYAGYKPQTVMRGGAQYDNQADCEAAGGSWNADPESGADGDPFRPRCEAQRQTLLVWMPPANEQRPAWQMVSPTPSDQCEAFGAPGMWSTDKLSDQGEYGHLYWRCYECCVPNNGAYIGNLEWDGCEF